MRIKRTQLIARVEEDPLPLLVQDDGYPRRKKLAWTVGGAVIESQFPINVCQKIKLELLIRFEDGVCLGSIKRNTENLDTEFVEVSLSVAEPATF